MCRTAASISELERGRVQISATDLKRISELLKKPIEYFYGEDFSGSAVQDLIALVRDLETNEIQGIIDTITSMKRIQEITRLIEITNDENELANMVKEFYEAFQPYLKQLTSLQSSGMDAQQKLQEFLGK